MTSLVDHVDRITALAKSIRAAAIPSSNNVIPGLFTRAVLDTPLLDLIRDIDPAELGLFTLVQNVTIPEVETGSVEIARVEFTGATPLRKPPSSRNARADGSRHPREHEPEVYASAASKYLDRYQSIRPMPRASEQASQIIQRLEEVRASIRDISEQLQQHAGADIAQPPLSPKSALKEEERHVNDLQSQIQYLKERKAELARKKARVPLGKRIPKTPAVAKPSSTNEERVEETFWNTPGAAARTLHFTGDSLLDEEVDLANVSTASFGTPLAAQRKVVSHPLEVTVSEPPHQLDYFAEEKEVYEALVESDDADEPTMVLRRELNLPDPEVPVPPDPSPRRKDADEPSSLPRDPETQIAATPHRQKVKVTTELERIVEKLWATVGDLIMPGHMFDALGTSTNKSKPPRAKETMAYLRELSLHVPTPSSPSASSFSSFSAPVGPNTAPNVQQILTAHMLLALLGAPSQALGLRVLKELLSEKATSVGAGTGAALMGGSAVTKPIYGCVAKRLLKIDRGAGEQVVKFDL